MRARAKWGRGLGVAGAVTVLCLALIVMNLRVQALVVRLGGEQALPARGQSLEALHAWLASPERARDPVLTYLDAGSRSVSELGRQLRGRPTTRVVIGRIAFERLFDKPRARTLPPEWPESRWLQWTERVPGNAIAAARADQARRERLWRSQVGETLRKHYERAYENESWLVLERRNAPDAGRATITLDSAVTYQTIVGWEATAGAEQDPAWGALSARQYDGLVDRLVRVAVEELGINRLRLELRVNAEHPRDLWAEWQKNRDAKFYRAHFYVSENDNADPNQIDPAGFHFSSLDNTVSKLILPMKRALEARGEKLWVNLEVIDYWAGASNRYAEQPAEYAELVLAACQHLDQSYGLRPDSLELLNEPDHPRGPLQGSLWTGERLGRALVAAQRALSAHGYHPQFVGPSSLKAAASLRYLDAMLAVPGARGLLSELSYHRYGDDGDEVIGAIGRRARALGIRSAMAERLGADYATLHRDLKFGQVSSWQLYALGAVDADPDTRTGYVQIDPAQRPIRVVASNRARLLSQYFRQVRAGAQRFEARSRDLAVDPLAFRNPDGRVVVVVKVDRPRALAIRGLPPGRYAVSYSSDTEYQVALPGQVVEADGELDTRMPAVGVLTAYAQ